MFKVKKLTKKAGFTKEQQTQIADVILNEINAHANVEALTDFVKKYDNDIKKAVKDNNFLKLYGNPANEQITINLIDSKCKYTLNNKIDVLFTFLSKVGISVTVNEIENKIFEKIKKLSFNGVVKTTIDSFSNGDFAVLKNYVGEISKGEKLQDVNFNKDLNSFLTDDLIKIDNYNKAEKIGHKRFKGKYYLIYKDKENYNIFNQSYIDLFKKDCTFYLSSAENRKMLYAVKDGMLIGVIMPVDNTHVKYEDFLFIPEIENTTKDEIIRKEEILNGYGIPTEMREILDETTDNMVNSKEYKEIIKESNRKQQKNAVTGHVYMGNNAELLQNAGYNTPLWVGKGQAKKLGKQIKNNAKGIIIKVYYVDDDGRSFCKLETVYNVEELEPIQKVENTNIFKKMIERLKKVV